MTKFHISEDGKARPCRAKFKCSLIHGDSAEDAYKEYEKVHGLETFKTLQKEPFYEEQVKKVEESQVNDFSEELEKVNDTDVKDEVIIKKTVKRRVNKRALVSKNESLSSEAVSESLSDKEFSNDDRVMKKWEARITALENTRSTIAQNVGFGISQEFIEIEENTARIYNEFAKSTGNKLFEEVRILRLNELLSNGVFDFKKFDESTFDNALAKRVIAVNNTVNAEDLYRKTKDINAYNAMNYWELQTHRLEKVIAELENEENPIPTKDFFNKRKVANKQTQVLADMESNFRARYKEINNDEGIESYRFDHDLPGF